MHCWDSRGAVDRPICRIEQQEVRDGLRTTSMEGDKRWDFIGEKLDRDSVLEEGVHWNLKIMREMRNYQLLYWFSDHRKAIGS